MTNHAKVGGILSVISGALGALLLFFFLFLAYIMRALSATGYLGYRYDESTLAFVTFFYFTIGVISGVAGVFAIVGGIFALRRKTWGLALAGAITSIVSFFPIGIPAVIFVAMGRPEFASPAPPVPPAPTSISSSAPTAAS